MNGEEKFKQSLKDLVDARDFPFEEKDWDRASVYFARQRNRFKLRIATLTVLVIAGLTTGIVLLDSPNEKQPFADNSLKTPAESQRSGISESGDVKSSAATAAHGNATPNVPGITRSDSRALTPSAAAGDGPVKAPVRTGKTAVNFERISPSAEKNPYEVTGQTNMETDPEVTVNVIASADNEKEEYDNEAAIAESVDGINDVPDKAPVSHSLAITPEPAGSDDEQSIPEKSVSETIASSLTATEEKNQPSVPAPEIAEKQKESEPAALKESTTDSTSNNQSLLATVSLEAGVSLYPGWTSAQKEATAVSPFGGIHYRSMITDKISISVGVQYHKIAGLSAYTHTSASTRLSFGEESEVTAITPRELHYIAAPLRLLYSVNSKNVIGLGYQLAYLLDVQSEVQTYSLKNNQKTDVKTFGSRGYTDGFRIFDSQLSLIYRRMVVSRLWLQADVHIGITDIKDNGFFGDAKTQRSTGARIGIVFDLSSK